MALAPAEVGAGWEWHRQCDRRCTSTATIGEASLLVALPDIAFLLAQRYFMEGVTLIGLKG